MYLIDMFNKKMKLPGPGEALKGRTTPVPTARNHFVNGRPLKGPFPEGFETAVLALGCYWGAERLFWETPGVWVTAAGFAGGETLNPTYQESCTGLTGHAEAVLVVFDPGIITFEEILAIFWEAHDPTQGMKQGNDIGTAYRSGIYPQTVEQMQKAVVSRDAYQDALRAAGRDKITTEIREGQKFYFAEAFHQQYLAKNPDGYCAMRGTGVACPVPART